MRLDGSERLGARVCLLAALATVATLLVAAAPARATEALGDLDLQARVPALVPVGTAGSVPAAVAEIELVLQSLRTATDVRVRVLTPDGRVWSPDGKEFDPGPIAWKKPDGGEPLEASDGSVILESRSPLFATILVPVKGAAVHAVVVEVRATTVQGEIATTVVVRVPLGVPASPIVDDGETATFPMMEVNP